MLAANSSHPSAIVMSITRHRARIRISSFVLLFLAASAAHAGEIKPLMRDMKSAMRGAMNSSTMAQFSGYVTRLENDATLAGRQPYRSDPATYREGMQALQREFGPVDEAIHANDLAGAKRELAKIDQTRRHYHDLLN